MNLQKQINKIRCLYSLTNECVSEKTHPTFYAYYDVEGWKVGIGSSSVEDPNLKIAVNALLRHLKNKKELEEVRS